MAENELMRILSGGMAGAFKAWGGAATERIKEESIRKREENLSRLRKVESTEEFGREQEAFKTQRGLESAEEETKYKQRSAEEEKRYKQRLGEEEKQYQRKTGEEEKTYNRREKGKTSDLEKKYNFLVNVFGEEEAKKLILSSEKKDDTGQASKLKLDALTKAYDMKNEGASDEEINAILDTAGIDSWVRQKTGKILKEGGFLGIGATKTEEITFGPRKGLLGGVPSKAGDVTIPKEPQAAGSDITALFSEADQRLIKEQPGLLSKTTKTPSKENLTGILNKPKEYQTGAYEPYSIAPGETPSIKEKVQGWASQTQSESGGKFGEGVLETAIRQAGFGKNLSEIKDMADNLRKQFPKMTDEQLAEIVKNAKE